MTNQFRPAQGTEYFALLKAMHKQLKPALYLEIGSRTGNSLSMAAGDFIAIDPTFVLKRFTTFPGQQGHLFQMPSDDFFETGFLQAVGRQIDFGFLDGMHHFEFLLRDFMNSERNAAPGATLTLHDCCPFNANMTERDRANVRGRAWTGDVWKVLVILLELRPDLQITVYDAAPTGIVSITGLDPQNRVLNDAYDDLMARYIDLNISDFGATRFYDMFEYASSAAYIADANKDA
ncbi:class I SAM-dependent methyltransferase [Pontivivens nitratireducens]|uniref:Class I SAM-dependent methyltransferase n=1 Tax=Pontivivens nitratireducens TaxID=2758038 RepID=A0A6G7VR35_9RHOB|nr:class I SAM-dependent methyltransferase [Pontibrevibacter nitratireducens]QIK42318.1 class I SAM-dependent methyltransferase [Pontibrevibacter nitratireducens]